MRSKFFLQQFVDFLWIGLSAGGFHDLPYEETKQRGFPGPVLGKLLGTGGHNLADNAADFITVGYLADAQLLYGLARALGA